MRISGWVSRFCPCRRSSLRSRASSGAEPLAGSLMGTSPGAERGRAQGAPSPSPRGKGPAWFRRARAAVGRRLARLRPKKPAGFGAVPTDPDPKPELQAQVSATSQLLIKPRLLSQESSLSLVPVPQREPLMPQQSSSFQPEVKQGVIAKLNNDLSILQAKLQQAEAFAILQREVARLQAKLEQSVSNEAAARQRALRAELRELARNEGWTRGDVQVEADKDWDALVLAFHTRRDDIDDTAVPDGATDTQAARRCAPYTGISDAELVLPEPTRSRSPTYARDCLFIDVVCHWVGSFVHRDWARVCSTTAAAVYRALIERRQVWWTTCLLLGEFQSVGARRDADNQMWGPEPGPLAAARAVVLDLCRDAARTDIDNLDLRDSFVIHLQICAHMYEDMRLHVMQVFQTASIIANRMYYVLSTLEEALEMRKARVTAAAAGNTAPSPASTTH